MGLWSNIQKHLFSGSSSAETLFRQKQLIPATFYLKSISLLLISATLISALYLSTIPWFMSAVGNETSEPEISYCLWWKLFCYSSQSHLTPETFVSPSALCLYFVLFLFSFSALLRPPPQIYKVWLTETPQKVLTKSPYVTNK